MFRQLWRCRFCTKSVLLRADFPRIGCRPFESKIPAQNRKRRRAVSAATKMDARNVQSVDSRPQARHSRRLSYTFVFVFSRRMRICVNQVDTSSQGRDNRV